MAKQPRIYLFHGNDSRASSRALSAWDARFKEKYGDTTRYIFNADDLSPEVLEKQLREALVARGLFPEPALIIVKRLSVGDRGIQSPVSTRVATLLSELLTHIDEQVTIAFWEEKRLADKHPLMLWFLGHEERNQAKVTLHQSPTSENGAQAAEKYLGELGVRLHPRARIWIKEQLQWLEKSARSVKRLKSTDELAQDERSWWLYHALDSALLQAPGNEVGVAELEMGVGAAVIPVSIFECVNALVSGRYDEARMLIASWQETSDEGGYYGLYSLLKRQYGDRRNGFALRLLADIELISKNTTILNSWLMEMFILRMQDADFTGTHTAIISPKKLWQSQLPRS